MVSTKQGSSPSIPEGKRPYQPHFSNIVESPSTAIGLGLLTLGAGGALRLGKSLLDTYRRPDVISGPKQMPRRRSSGADIPLEVTEEEAEELRRQGVKVREVASKTASDEVVQGKPSALGGLALGAIGTGGALAGWGLTDMAINALRSRAAKADADRIRERIQRLLEDDPHEMDTQLHSQMKTAEDAYINGHTKVAAVDSLKRIGQAVDTAWWLLPALAGSGMTIHALGGLRSAMRDSRALEKAKARRRFARHRMISETPEARLVPVLRRQEQDIQQVMRDLRKEREAEEEEDKPSVDAVVVRNSGGPSEQAAKNTATKAHQELAAYTTSSAPSSSWF